MSETAAPAQTSPTQEADITSALGRRSVVLVGMMGAGKSTIGRRLAARLRLPFLDADIEIEDAMACIRCNACKEKASELERPELVKIDFEPYQMTFVVETAQSLTPDETFLAGVDQLRNKVKRLQGALRSEMRATQMGLPHETGSSHETQT